MQGTTLLRPLFTNFLSVTFSHESEGIGADFVENIVREVPISLYCVTVLTGRVPCRLS